MRTGIVLSLIVAITLIFSCGEESTGPSGPDVSPSTLSVAFTGDSSKGRWPSNTILSHHPDCVCVGIKTIKNKSGNVTEDTGLRKTTPVYGNMRQTTFKKHADSSGNEQVEDWECYEDCPIKILDDQSGNLRQPQRPGH